jgi:predicted dienelactone hydrolase
VVAAPEHIGSDAGQEARLLSGAASEIFQVSEFYDRPQDVSFVLDTLEQKNATEFGGRLNLNRVGVYGHSFGGYTVLALGGATVDFKRLREQCQGNYLLRSLNTSYLLQCRALELESSPQATLLASGQLQDPRVKLVTAISPVGSAMFGPTGIGQIKVPVLIFGGSDDPAAPLVPEQVEPFSWLTTQDKYLVVSNDISHTPEITEKIDQVTLPNASGEEIKARLEVFQKNLRGLGLALMQVYVAGKPEYSPYLLSSYTQTLRNPPYDFNLIRSFPPDRLKELERKVR